MREKFDDMIDRVVSITFNDYSNTVSFLVKVKGFNKRYLWGISLPEGESEELILPLKRCVGFSIIKPEFVEKMIEQYRMPPNVVKPDLAVS